MCNRSASCSLCCLVCLPLLLLCLRSLSGSCTQKYHVPLIFRIKNKDGPARVCMSCVEGCMAEKARASAPAVNPLSVSKLTQSSLASTQVSASLQSMVKVVEIAPPASWEEESAFVACPKCAAKKCKTHNCRVCGLLFCSDCTSKMEIPAVFERKKGKTGPSRVCDACRYRIVGGAKLVDKLSPAAAAAAAAAAPSAAATSPKTGARPPPPPPGALAGSSSSASASSPSSPSAAGAPPRVSEAPVSTVVHATVKREGDGSLVCQLSIPSPDTSLSTIDTLLKKMAPQGEAYSFVFRGAPIPEAFHAVFCARHLGSTLLIRPKHRHDLVTLQEEEWEGYGDGGAEGESGVSGVSATNNPFKRDAAAEAARQAAERKRKEQEQKAAQAKKAIREFKRPTKKQVIPISAATAASKPAAANGVTTNPVTGKKVPPPPPGSGSSSSSSSSASSAASDEVFKQRAKKLFGQI